MKPSSECQFPCLVFATHLSEQKGDVALSKGTLIKRVAFFPAPAPSAPPHPPPQLLTVFSKVLPFG